MNELSVAAAQFESFYGDVEANAARHLAVIDEARAGGVGLVVFPELSLTGHTAGKDALRLAMAADGAPLARLAAACGPIAAVVGFIEETAEGLFHNAIALLRDGAVLAVHRKANLATYGLLDDGKYFAHGDAITVVELAPGWRVALAVCADLWDPGLVHAAMLDGATLVAAPVSSATRAVDAGFDNSEGWDVNLRFHAMTYGSPVVMANRVGREGALDFWGGSRVVDALGRTVAMANEPVEGLVRATVRRDDMRLARFRLPTLRDARRNANYRRHCHA